MVTPILVSQQSIPLPLRILPEEGFGEFRIALAAAYRALDQIDPLSQIGKPGSAGGTVKGSRHGAQHQGQVQYDGQAVPGELLVYGLIPGFSGSC